MKRLVIWGGNKKPLTLDTLDSHASVNAYFLTKYLSSYYHVLNFMDMDRPEEILQAGQVDHVLSTFQFGVTNRIIRKGKHDIYHQIRQNTSGYITSLADRNTIGRFVEDVLFSVCPPSLVFQIISSIQSFKLINVQRSGWNADPDICYPEMTNEIEDDITIFLDHPSYGRQHDLTKVYFQAFCELKNRISPCPINVYQQNNSGIEELKLEPNTSLNVKYDRSHKVPFIQILDYYRKSHIFCITHQESAGLSAIEAALSGALLYVPKLNGRVFLRESLLDNNIPFRIFNPESDNLVELLENDITNGIDRMLNHRKVLANGNTWSAAVKKIVSVFEHQS